MTCEALVHMLGRDALRTTWELLDVATKYATSEKAILANFSGKGKAAVHLSGDANGDDVVMANRRRDKRGKDKKCRRKEMVDAADRAT
jgi:hypothetical protein